ncbi:transposase [Spirulina major]|uniref:transposase n=1 Tax=Spirulina major TaxID=270636 RepID=UPI00093414EB|nr:transposase [Spirulina major]
MPYNPQIHHRQSIRLRGYDYSQMGAYFLTLCTHNRECFFGRITNNIMHLNSAGQITQQCWQQIPTHFPHVQLDQFIIMPNHIHGIIWIVNPPTVGAKNFSPQSSPQPQGTSKTIGSIVRGFKIGVTKWMRQNTSIYQIWQRNYWERIIRSEPELHQIREYIQNNPQQWETDQLYPPF